MFCIQALFSWALDDIKLSPAVSSVVDKIWNEAVGEIERNLNISVSSLSRSSVEEAEGL